MQSMYSHDGWACCCGCRCGSGSGCGLLFVVFVVVVAVGVVCYGCRLTRSKFGAMNIDKSLQVPNLQAKPSCSGHRIRATPAAVRLVFLIKKHQNLQNASSLVS